MSTPPPSTCETDEYGFVVGQRSPSRDERTLFPFSFETTQHREAWDAALAAWDGNWAEAPVAELCQLVKRGIPNQLRGRVWKALAAHNVANLANISYAPTSPNLRVQHLHQLSSQQFQHHAAADTTATPSPSSSSSSPRHRSVPLSAQERASQISKCILEADEPTSEAARIFAELTSAPCTHQSQIDLDVPRTFPAHHLFFGDNASGRAQLQQVLCAVSLYNPGIGYCQGMSYVAAVLLMYVSPPEAFWLLNWMLQDLPNALGSYYTRSMSGVIRDSSLFAHMIGIHLPSLHRHLERHGIHELMYATPWFMTLFTSLPSWSSALRVFDMFFLEGTPAIFRFSMAVLQICEDELLAMRGIEQLLPYLQNLPLVKTIPSVLATTACSLPIAQFLTAARKRFEQAAAAPNKAHASKLAPGSRASNPVTPPRAQHRHSAQTLPAGRADGDTSKKRKRAPDSTPSLSEFLGWGSSNNNNNAAARARESPSKRLRTNERGDSRNTAYGNTPQVYRTPAQPGTATRRFMAASTPVAPPADAEPSTPSFFSRFWAKIATPIRQQIVSDEELLPTDPDTFITPITRRIMTRCTELQSPMTQVVARTSNLVIDAQRSIGNHLQAATGYAPPHVVATSAVPPASPPRSSDVSPDVVTSPATPASLRKSMASRRRRELAEAATDANNSGSSPLRTAGISSNVGNGAATSPPARARATARRTPRTPTTPLQGACQTPSPMQSPFNVSHMIFDGIENSANAQRDDAAFDAFRTPKRFSPRTHRGTTDRELAPSPATIASSSHAAPTTPLSVKKRVPMSSSPLGTELTPLSKRATRSPSKASTPSPKRAPRSPLAPVPRIANLRNNSPMTLSPLAKMR